MPDDRPDTPRGEPGRRPRRGIILWIVRYGIGLAMILAGVIVLLVAPSSTGVDGFAMAVGGGLSVLLLNYLYRLGVAGDQERERHEQAWQHFVEHGEWPEEEPARGIWRLDSGEAKPRAERERAE